MKFTPARGRADTGIVHLRRYGRAPLRFAGRLIARHEGCTSNAARGYDLALYVCAGGVYVAEVVAKPGRTALDRTVLHRATVMPTIEAAIDYFERYDIDADIWPILPISSLETAERSVSAPRQVPQAANFLLIRAYIFQNYQNAVGILLDQLARVWC